MFEWETLSTRRPADRARTAPPPAAAPGGERSSLVLGPKDKLVGRLSIEGDLRVTGFVEGELVATGDVEIDAGGRVTGPVTTHQRLVVGSAGSLIGDVRVARLVVEDGATFSGNVSMGKLPEAAPKPTEPVTVVDSEPAKPTTTKAKRPR